MKTPVLVSPTDQLIESLLELQKLATDAQDERLRAIDLRKAYELLREHRPVSKCTKACLDEVLAVEYKARTSAEMLVDRIKTLLLRANERVLAAERIAEQATAALASGGVKPVDVVVGAGSAKSADGAQAPIPANPAGEDLPIYQPKRGCQRKPHVAVAWLEEHSSEFPQDEWIAVDGFELVASDPSMPGLMQKLARRQVPNAEVCILYNESLAAGVARAVD